MKTGITTWITVALAAFSLNAAAQQYNEYGNINNQYGAPTFTGGTVSSPSESFAIYTQRNQPEQATLIEEVYPNPTPTASSVVLTTVAVNPVTLFIVNMNGTIMKTYNYDGGSSRLTFDMSGLQDGLYSIQVQERGKSMQSIRLLKQS